jgi:ABC-type Mn2+/Zn2+ transport system ATPase subunit
MSLFDASAPIPVIGALDLSLAYGGRVILREVTLTVMPGEVWFVIGPNGAGKSTLLKAMLGLLAPRSGDLALCRALDDRARLGFVPQRLDLPATVPTTVREFVAMGFTGLGLDRAERQRRQVAAITQVGLTATLGESMEELSGGQRQRAAIARALVRDPLLLVVDEPTTGLDLVAERDLMALLTSLNRERGLTIVFVAHDLGLVAAHATHVALVAAGQVVAGPAERILTSERLSQAYGLPIEVRQDDGRPSIRLR